jgi:hypothetical protein
MPVEVDDIDVDQAVEDDGEIGVRAVTEALPLGLPELAVDLSAKFEDVPVNDGVDDAVFVGEEPV